MKKTLTTKIAAVGIAAFAIVGAAALPASAATQSAGFGGAKTACISCWAVK